MNKMSTQSPWRLGTSLCPVRRGASSLTPVSCLLLATRLGALGLPDLAKPFTLYVTEKDKVAMVVLFQTMGTWDRPVVYLSNQLDNVATGRPGCLRAVAVVALLVWEVTKLALGQDLIIKVNTFEVNTLLRENPINGCQHPGLLNTRDCYVKTPMLLLSFVRP